MKRICSMFLATVLCLSLTAPALAAEEDGTYFRDAQDITNLAAATNLVRLGVMWGKEDGRSFDPQGEVTRGEATKYMALLLRGGEDITVSADTQKAEPAFPDTKGHWAEAYINYCAEKGAAFAQDDGNFDPNGPATGIELLRMCFIALGYDALTYKLIGDGWMIQTLETARKTGGRRLTEGLEDVAMAEHVTRDTAAQILYNTLQATHKVIGASGVYEDVQRPDGTPSTLLRENFGYDSWDDISPLPDKTKPEEPKPKAQRGIDPTILTDAKNIRYWDAVASLAQLGIISGRDDGSFDPAGNVTRAEAAKLIAVLMNGGSEANTGVRKEPSFTDIQGHWAEGWIEYCADMHIISGWDGRFDPDGQVSVIQFYKMALAALGYDPEAYGLMGSRWADRTMERARNTSGRDLTEGLPNEGMDGTGADIPASREVAAQILYNALLANPIMVSPDGQNDDGEVIWKYSAKEDDTLLHQRFDLKEMPTVPPQPTV